MGPLGKERRGEVREALKKVLALAKERRADLVLIAGDLFEHPRVSRDTISFLQDAFGSLGAIPICIAPGNHDPYLPDSPYATAPWPANVHVFSEDRWTVKDFRSLGVRLHGIAHTSFQDNTHHLRDLRITKDDQMHIVLMHGSDLGEVPPAYEHRTYFPFRREELERCGAHYVALGHYHSFKALPEGAARPLGCYSGCPEGTGFDDEGRKVALLVGLDATHLAPEPLTTSQRQYVTATLDCTGARTREEIIQRLRAIAERQGWRGWLARVVLEGDIEPTADLDLVDLAARGRGDLFHLELVNQTMPTYDLGHLRQEQSARGEFVRRIERLLADIPGGPERATLELALAYGLDAFFRRRIAER
jgi:DNA repair exonuclease SbcCD nuclease subunit